MRKPDAVRDHAEYLRYINEQARLELKAYCRAPLILEPLTWKPSDQFAYQRIDVRTWPAVELEPGEPA